MSLKPALDHLFSRPRKFVVSGCFLSLSVTTVLLSMAEPASATPITVSIDENGSATISPSSAPLAIPLIGQDTDPISGIQTLRYEISSSSGSPPLTSGDVEVCENPACTSISDVLRFVNDTNTQLFVFSDVETGETSQADVGIPSSSPRKRSTSCGIRHRRVKSGDHVYANVRGTRVFCSWIGYANVQLLQ